MTSYDLATVFKTVASAIPDHEVLVWRDRRLTYAQLDARADGLRNHLVAQGLGLHTERAELPNHESGQDHVGVYLRNGNEYLEALIGSYRARTAPFNVNFRYVEEELLYLLTDARTTALIYHAEFAPRVAAIRDRLPQLRVLIQVADHTGNELLPGAVDYEEALTTPEPAELPTPSGEDLYLIYTGGTTGMPKGVMWQQHDIYVSSMGGTPFGGTEPYASYEALAEHVTASAGGLSILMALPFMHGAAQWSAYHMFSSGGKIVLPDEVVSFDAADVLRTAIREGCTSIPIVGDAVARPLVEEIERAAAAGEPYDLSGIAAINNGSAPLTPTMRNRLLAAMPHIFLLDAAGASESGMQMTTMATKDSPVDDGVFTPLSDTAVLDDEHTRVLEPGESGGWLARRDRVPLGYLGDEAKTKRTFPVVDGVRWSVPGDRADVLPDGRLLLRGRDGVTINSGGEKIYAEEVERAVAAHPAVGDVVVVGRASEQWGQVPVAVVELVREAGPEELIAEARKHVAGYKVPRDVVVVDKIVRSPSGKADYRWAREQSERAGADAGASA